MKYMWVRLSFAFSGMVFISFIAVIVISGTIIRLNYEQSAQEDQTHTFDGLRDQLALYYQNHGSWDGVDVLFAGATSMLPLRLIQSVSYTLTAPNGQVIYGTLPSSSDADTQPVVVSGQTVANLITVWKPPPIGVFRGAGIFRGFSIEELLLIIAVVGGFIGVLFGILISRSLTAPLDDLTAAAHEIGEGQAHRHVQVKGSVEITSLADSFNRMVDQLQNAELLRRNLVADVAHELRTPITALQANLYAILDDAYPLTKTEIAGLYDQTRLLGRLVNDLHELSQAEAHQLPLTRKPVDLARALEEFAATFYLVAETKDITFDLRLPRSLPLVSVDEQRIKQVLQNLLSNALRHTPVGGTITLNAGVVDGCVQFTVSDNGEGIKAEHLPHVFERFYRVDYGRSREAGGTGLGLAVAKAIVEAHDGAIQVSSPGIPGQGATFTVRLPLAAHREPERVNAL